MKGGFIMRLQLKKFIAVTLCLSVVLSSCTIRPGNHSKEALSQRPVSTVDTTGSDPQTFVITLLEGQTTAMVNGTEAQLSVAPLPPPAGWAAGPGGHRDRASSPPVRPAGYPGL